MQIIIDSMIRLRDVPLHILSAIKKDLTMVNPMYVKKKRIGLPIWGTEKEIRFYQEVDDALIIPRGYLQKVANLPGTYVIDNRVLLPKVQYPKKPNLRDYQEPFVIHSNDCDGSGICVAPCGSGKTASFMGIIYDKQQPTLWLTHTIDLLEQSMASAKRFLGVDSSQIGILQGESFNIGSHITFATVQTLANRDLTGIARRFGCVVVDECHLVFNDDEKKMRLFNGVISQFPAYHRYGATASEHRSDGLINSMFHILGPKLYEVAQDDPRLPTMKPKVEFIPTEFFYQPPEDKMMNVAIMAAKMKDDIGRNEILKSVLLQRVDKSDYCLALGDNLEHLGMLKRHVEKMGRTAAFIHGKTPKPERKAIMDAMRAGKYNYMFATYQLAKLGLDVPILNKLLLTTPKKDKTAIQQAVGRIMRPEEGKPQPEVFDVIDRLTPQLRAWGGERIKVYKQLGCELPPDVKSRRK